MLTGIRLSSRRLCSSGTLLVSDMRTLLDFYPGSFCIPDRHVCRCDVKVRPALSILAPRHPNDGLPDRWMQTQHSRDDSNDVTEMKTRTAWAIGSERNMRHSVCRPRLWTSPRGTSKFLSESRGEGNALWRCCSCKRPMNGLADTVVA